MARNYRSEVAGKGAVQEELEQLLQAAAFDKLPEDFDRLPVDYEQFHQYLLTRYAS